MGMPEIPEGKNRPSLDNTIIDLLESIALEEMAIAHIMNAEGEKLQEIIKKYNHKDICSCNLEQSFKNSRSMVNSLIMKEWLLLVKMNSILELKEENKQEKPYGKIC